MSLADWAQREFGVGWGRDGGSVANSLSCILFIPCISLHVSCTFHAIAPCSQSLFGPISYEIAHN